MVTAPGCVRACCNWRAIKRGGRYGGGGIYESELVKEGGVWKFKHLHLYRTYQVDYRTGWEHATAADGWLPPTRSTPPFHYRNPVSGH